MPPDNEINALNNVYETLKGLNNAEIKRILNWVKKNPGSGKLFFEELLLFSTAKTNIAKILLAGAYLQVEKNFKEFANYDISSLFKEIGENIGPPSQALSPHLSQEIVTRCQRCPWMQRRRLKPLETY